MWRIRHHFSLSFFEFVLSWPLIVFLVRRGFPRARLNLTREGELYIAVLATIRHLVFSRLFPVVYRGLIYHQVMIIFRRLLFFPLLILQAYHQSNEQVSEFYRNHKSLP